MAAGVVVLEAKIGAHRAASNIGSVARLEDVGSDGGISAAQTETGDNVCVGPLPVFTGAESSIVCASGGASVIVDNVDG